MVRPVEARKLEGSSGIEIPMAVICLRRKRWIWGCFSMLWISSGMWKGEKAAEKRQLLSKKRQLCWKKWENAFRSSTWAEGHWLTKLPKKKLPETKSGYFPDLGRRVFPRRREFPSFWNISFPSMRRSSDTGKAS